MVNNERELRDFLTKKTDMRTAKLGNSEVVHLFPKGKKFALGFDESGNLKLYKVEEAEI